MATRIGMLTPSSNTVLEPLTYKMLEGIDGVSAHFSRLRVTKMTAGAESDAQFASAAMLASAELLADAAVDILAWNGTAGSRMGPDGDRRLCRELSDATGIPATTSTLALIDACEALGVSRVGLATPYVSRLNELISHHYAREGIQVVASEHLGLADNLAVGALTPEEIRSLVVRAARDGAQAVAVVCTNVAATEIVQELEQELGIPLRDSIAVTLWKCLDLAGSARRPDGFGKVMAASSTRPDA
jgi:maleate isomerase